MDDNRITSTDFDYDAYTGGSSYSDSNITSSDFDYDVYSGKSAMEYLRQENERRREALRQAKKSVAELKREEYENKFAGMSADELFGMPKKKKNNEDDFSDFFDADEIERQREHQKRMEQELKAKMPKVENMMPGEDTPSSQQVQNERYNEGIQTAAEMMAHQRIRREIEDEHFREYRRRGRLNGYGREVRMISSLFGVRTGGGYYRRYSGESSELDKALSFYFISFIIGAVLGGLLFGAAHIGLIIVSGAVGGALGGFIKRNGIERQSVGEAVANSRLELAIIGVAVVIGLIIELM